MKYNQPKILITGGGTGGHVFPAIAIANALSSTIGKENILFVGALGKMEMTRVPQAGYTITGLPIRGLQGKVSLHNLLLPFRLLSSLIKAGRILKKFKPDVVVGVGGFASAPVLWRATRKGIPVVIQEQNSIAGKVNRFIGRKATRVFVAFESAMTQFPEGVSQLTGNPVRRSILESPKLKQEGCHFYQFDPQKPVLLIVGGSQGSMNINRALLQHLPTWTDKGIQVIWQTGKHFHQQAEDFLKTEDLHGVVATPFIEKMEIAYGAADLVISRAGALAISEISLARLPAIYVPFPFAADDHQTHNAETMVAHKAAMMLTDLQLVTMLGNTVSSLIFDEKRLTAMKKAAHSLSHPDADVIIASAILKLANSPQKKNISSEIPADFSSFRVIYFLGAGGIGMSGLARWFKLTGKEVHGYDRVATPLTLALEKEGINIHYEDRPDLIPDNTDLAVITPAIPSTLAERVQLEKSNIPMMKRAEVLGRISHSMKTIAVAGTHGKTSTSALITHLLKNAGVPVTAFVGGITKNYNTNFIFTTESQYLVAEADEFDRSFLHLKPDFSIITSTDADHLDIYETHNKMLEAFKTFGKLNGDAGALVVNHKVLMDFDKEVQYYALEDHAARYTAFNIVSEGIQTKYDLRIDQELHTGLVLGIPGRHNAENSVAAIAAALWAGLTMEEIRKGLASFEGVRRRFDIRINRSDLVYIDDYAHHPSELDACLDSVRKIFPGRKMTVLFQPHLFTRTRDFADGFAQSLSKSDKLILLPIYPARETPIEGIDSAMLLNKTNHQDKILLEKTEVVSHLKTHKPEVLVTLGAGDIDTLVPQIEQVFNLNNAPL